MNRFDIKLLELKTLVLLFRMLTYNNEVITRYVITRFTKQVVWIVGEILFKYICRNVPLVKTRD